MPSVKADAWMGPKPKKKQQKNRHLANDILKVELDRSRVPLKRSLRVTTKPGDFLSWFKQVWFFETPQTKMY